MIFKQAYTVLFCVILVMHVNFIFLRLHALLELFQTAKDHFKCVSVCSKTCQVKLLKISYIILPNVPFLWVGYRSR